MSEYTVVLKGEHRPDDGLQIDMGALKPDQAWWEVPLPPCPDCGSVIAWWEAGYGPGTRKCVGKPKPNGRYDPDSGCGSLFSVQTANRRVSLRRERFY